MDRRGGASDCPWAEGLPDPDRSDDPDRGDDGAMVMVEQWSVFRRGTQGGSPCPVVTDARALAPAQMLAIAAHYSHESAFVTDVTVSGVRMRYFVPAHEMRMCVHATIAAVIALAGSGALCGRDTLVRTASGQHRVSWSDGDPPEVTVELHPPTLRTASRSPQRGSGGAGTAGGGHRAGTPDPVDQRGAAEADRAGR
jgi:hypothetical protein